MNTHSGTGAAMPHMRTDQTLKLLRGLSNRDEQIQEAAALLLLLGNEVVRLHEQSAGWEDDDFSGFIAAGFIGITHKAAQTLHQATRA